MDIVLYTGGGAFCVYTCAAEKCPFFIKNTSQGPHMAQWAGAEARHGLICKLSHQHGGEQLEECAGHNRHTINSMI